VELTSARDILVKKLGRSSSMRLEDLREAGRFNVKVAETEQSALEDVSDEELFRRKEYLL
jgi:hypothetical protein